MRRWIIVTYVTISRRRTGAGWSIENVPDQPTRGAHGFGPWKSQIYFDDYRYMRLKSRVALSAARHSEEREEMKRKKKDRTQKEIRPSQHHDYSRVMTETQAVKLYMSGPQFLPYEAWKNYKGLETYEEVYR